MIITRLAQREKFFQFSFPCSFFFNRGFNQRQIAFEATGKNLSYFAQNKELTTLKQIEETSWLKQVPSQVLQQEVKGLENVFLHFFRRIKRSLDFPNSKRKDSMKVSISHKEWK